MRFPTPVWLAVALAAGCSSSAPSTRRPEAAAPAHAPAAPVHAPAAPPLAGIPADAVAAGWIVLPATLGDLAATGLSPEERDALRAELQDALSDGARLDLRDVRSLAWFARIGPSGPYGAVLVRSTAGGVDFDPGPRRIDDGVVATRRGDTLVIGHPTAVDAALRALAGDEPGLSAGAPLGALLARAADAPVAVAVAGAPIQPMLAQAGLPPIDSLLVRADRDRLRWEIAAPADVLAQLEDEVGAAWDEVLAEAEQDLARGKSENGAIAFLAIALSHQYRHLHATTRPRVEGGRLVSDVPVPGIETPSTWMIVAGAAAAVAVPAFMKYIKKSKAAEARDNVKRLAELAARRAASGEPLVPAPLTPANPTACCERCDDPTAWQTPAWQSVGFSPGGPHYYAYELEVVSRGTDLEFTARAVGDLDCDGVYSTFEMPFRRQGSAPPSAADLFVDNELE